MQRRSDLVAQDPAVIASTMAAAEGSADGAYDTLAALAPTEEDRTGVPRTRAGPSGRTTACSRTWRARAEHPQSALDRILGRERHVRGGGWIGQAIYGINDGLGAAFGVVSGVAGATHVNSSFVLLSGFASMVASALSMGSGAYLAVKSEKEVHEAELARERNEIKEHPEEEREELSLFYQLKGFTEAEANAMAARMAENPEEMLRPSPTRSWVSPSRPSRTRGAPRRAPRSATAVGAAVPVLPYLFIGGITALITSFVDQHPRAFRRGRGQGGGHGTLLVEERPGDDGDRAGRGGHHVRHRAADFPAAGIGAAEAGHSLP